MKFALALVFLIATVSCGDLGYDWRQNGDDWGVNFPDCNGLMQSPVDIRLRDTRLTNVPGVRSLGAKPMMRPLEYLGRDFVGDVEVEIVDDDVQMVGGTVHEPWNLLAFHFHAPSEHQFEGIRFPMEAHYVHDSGYGDFAVVGYLFRVVHYSAGFIHEIAEAIRNGEEMVRSSARLPITRGNFFHYRGSFTTPPCTERVDWHVYQTSIPITQEDLDTITGAMTAGNFRNTQPLNGRTIGVSDGCGIGHNHYAFNHRGKECSAGAGPGLSIPRSMPSWENTGYAPHLRTQHDIVGAMFSNPELRPTAEIFADILEYNKLAVLENSQVGDYQFTKAFPDIQNKELQSHLDQLAGAFSRETLAMESLDFQRYDAHSAIANFNSTRF